MSAGSRAIFQGVILVPGREPMVVPIDRFPWVLGRARDASVHLPYPGVWERHLVLELDPREGLVATVGSGALASVDGQPLTRSVLRHGAEITLGSVVARFSLSPARRRSLGLWEVIFWGLLAVVGLAQIVWAWRMLAP